MTPTLPTLTVRDCAVLDLHADNVVLRVENEDLRQQVSYLEAQVESYRDALDLLNREK